MFGYIFTYNKWKTRIIKLKMDFQDIKIIFRIFCCYLLFDQASITEGNIRIWQRKTQEVLLILNFKLCEKQPVTLFSLKLLTSQVLLNMDREKLKENSYYQMARRQSDFLDMFLVLHFKSLLAF